VDLKNGVEFTSVKLSRAGWALETIREDTNNAKNEDEPECRKAFQGDGYRQDCLLEGQCEPYPDKKDDQEETKPSKECGA
jgi:hypothetical protein